ncbi:DUF4260 domain-containing protein [Paenibacillus cremeus]|uniref:DUF4260 family protein n=1 Tax=Paenibacillus cremeus TaxID=2163881 RepID=A0A559K0H8_9BACL|nr:DUF4260 domain-containing protein [Paenibacillus cremeus]TVY05587.1 DUF4260 family protein [Paenibacillus cremeus]
MEPIHRSKSTPKWGDELVKSFLRLEGLFVFIACLYAYYRLDYGWLWFIVLFLFPDLSMIGYIKGNVAGARVYNVFHTYLTSGVFISLGVILDQTIFLQIGLIWTAHIGIDRMAEYGLKYTSDFKATHINRM